MTMPGRMRCLVCDGSRPVPLPAVGHQSMASDWRVLPAPLRKSMCADCGLVSSLAPPFSGLFDEGYSLYAHPPSADPRERRRQQIYARWIAQARERAGQATPPSAILDVGCGNGSLLVALRDQWPSATLLGCDPSGDAIAHATATGCSAWRGTSASVPAHVQAELVVSVNVIEHVDDVLAFLQDLKRGLARDGTLVLICPDGGRPGFELLIADHAHSFASGHLRELLQRSDLAPRHAEPAPIDLGPFQMIIADNRPAPSIAPIGGSAIDVSHWQEYLQRWSALDGQLFSRLGDGGVSCFGLGETAGLLRAYAPQTWQRVRWCTADDVADSQRFGAVPAVPLDEVASDEPLLLGVRPRDQAALVERLWRFTRIISWHDLIEA